MTSKLEENETASTVAAAFADGLDMASACAKIHEFARAVVESVLSAESEDEARKEIASAMADAMTWHNRMQDDDLVVLQSAANFLKGT